MSRSNIPALPPIIQDLPPNSVGDSAARCPPSTGSEPPPHRATVLPAPRPSPTGPSPLEGRVAAVEQANCSLLEEVVRLHSKLRAGQRGGVEERREELGSVGGQVQQVQQVQQELSSLVQRAGLERQSVEETSRQLQLSVEGVEAKVASSVASLASWRMSFQCRLEQLEGDTRVRWQGVQGTVGGLQRGLEQTREGLRMVEREGGEQMAVLNTSLKDVCSRMDAAESWQQRVESTLQGVQEDMHQLFSQEEAWQRDSTHRFVQLEARVAEVEQGLDSLRLSLTDQERNASERLAALERVMEEGLAQRDKSLQLVVQRLEETMSEAAKEREHLAASLQAVAEGGQRELCSAEDRLLRHQQKAELRCGETSRSQWEAASRELQQVREDTREQIVQLETQINRHGDSLTHTVKRERVATSKAMSALSDSVKLVQREGEASRRHLSNVLHAEVTVRQRELAALQSALTEVGRHVKEETSVLTSGQQELEVAQAALRERLSREAAQLLGTLHSATERVLQDMESRFRTAHTTLMHLQQQDLDRQTRISTLQQAMEASIKDLTRQIEVEQAARKAALGYLGELIQGRVSLEMHNEETHRHQEAHKQMDHHLAALRAQVNALQSTLNQLHLQAVSEASHDRGQLKDILTRLQEHLKVGEEEEEGPPRGNSDCKPSDGQVAGGVLSEDRHSSRSSLGQSLDSGSKGLSVGSQGGLEGRDAATTGDPKDLDPVGAAIRSVQVPTGSIGEQQGATLNGAGGEESEGGNQMGAIPPEDLQLQSNGSVVEELPLDMIQEGDTLDFGDYDVISLEQEGSGSGAGAAVGERGDSEVSSGAIQGSPSVVDSGEQISLKEGSPLCDEDGEEEVGQVEESSEGEPEQSTSVEQQGSVKEGGTEAKGAVPGIPSRPSTLLGRTSSVFIKHEEEEGMEQNKGAGSLNQWGVYQAWRLLQIKEAWMRPLLRKKAAAQQRDSPQ